MLEDTSAMSLKKIGKSNDPNSSFQFFIQMPDPLPAGKKMSKASFDINISCLRDLAIYTHTLSHAYKPYFFKQRIISA